MFRSSPSLCFTLLRPSRSLLVALHSCSNDVNNHINKQSPSPVVLSASEESMHRSKGIFKEREEILADFEVAREKSLRQKGANYKAVKDAEFDEEMEQITGVKFSGSGQQFRIKVTKPAKPSDNEPNRLEIKPGQTFSDAVTDHLKLQEEADKQKEEMFLKMQQQSHEKAKNKKKNTKKSTTASFSSSSKSGAFHQTQFNLSSSSIKQGIPKAPPLPGGSGAGGNNKFAGNLPSDDQICFHLRGIIEKSATHQKDITTLQLSLTQEMMNALAERHFNSLLTFISRFPARFKLDEKSGKVELIGVPKPNPTPQQQQKSVNFNMGSDGQNNNNSSSAGEQQHQQQQQQATPKPLHPSELRKQQIQQQRQQQQQEGKSSQKIQPQQPQQQKTVGTGIPQAPPIPSLHNKNPTQQQKFAAPSLPNLPGQFGGGGAGGGGAHDPSVAPSTVSQQLQHKMETAFMTKNWKSPAEIVDELMEYVPSYWIPTRLVHNQLPFEIKELYQQKMRLNNFLKKYNFYFDAKVTAKGAEIKVRDDCKHPKKGNADERYGTHLRQMEAKKEMEAQVFKAQQEKRQSLRSKKPPRYVVEVDPHSIAGQLKQLCSNQFQSIRDFQNSLPGTVTSHPDYDTSVGVLPTLEKHPFIFQVAKDSVRLRQSGTAPNALDSKGRTPDDSPLPHIFSKIMSVLPGESYDDTPVEVSAILAKLNVEERDEIKKKFRSLPRFLRLHGAAIEVSRDNTTVRRWEEPENSSAAGGKSSLSQAEQDEIDALNNNEDFEDPNEPSQISDGAMALPKAGKDMAEASNVQWALKELYSSLPLSTAVVLEDAISMLPSQMRDAAATCPNLIEEIQKYPDYFQVWVNPDDEKGHIIQRTIVGTPTDISADDVAEHAAKLVPQGGIDYEKLMRRMPPKMQRYLFRHGIKTTLKKRSSEFLVVGDKILYIAEREY